MNSVLAVVVTALVMPSSGRPWPQEETLEYDSSQGQKQARDRD